MDQDLHTAGDGEDVRAELAELAELRAQAFEHRKAAARFDAFFDLVPVGLAIADDTHCRVIRANTTLEKILGVPADTNISKSAPAGERPDHFKVMRDGHEVPADELPLQRAAATGVAVDGHKCHLVFDDGRVVDLWGMSVPLLDPDGRPAGSIGAFVDVTQSRKNRRKLTEAKKAAEAACRSRDTFLAMLSHELRAPLSPLVSTLDAWQADGKLPETLRDDVRMMRRNLDLQIRLIDDLLDLQRVTHGKLSVTLEPCDLHEIVHGVLEMAQSDLHVRGVTLTVSLDAASHAVAADPTRLQQVIWNVVRNGAKFTPKGGTIRVTTRDGPGGCVALAVSDTGIGMGPETVCRVFEPFSQADDEVVRRAGGLGLGLAIAKQLVELQGGTIEARSAGVGRGSTFVITLPVAAGTPADEPRHAVEAPDDCRTLSILLTEDHEDTARALARLLRLLGHKVTVADTIADSLTLLATNAYDLLLSDIGLPDGTGLDLIARVRETSDMPAVALTGFGMDEDVQQCLRAGFTAHLSKPVNVLRLELLLKQLCHAPAGDESHAKS